MMPDKNNLYPSKKKNKLLFVSEEKSILSRKFGYHKRHIKRNTKMDESIKV